MAKYTPRNTSAVTNKFGALVTSSWRGVNTIRAYGQTAPTVVQPANAQQLLTAAAKSAWELLTDSERLQWLAVQAVNSAVVVAPGSGYTSLPSIEFIFTTYNSILTSGGGGYPDTPTGIIQGAGVFPNFIPLAVVSGAVELAFDQFYVTTGSGTPTVTISGGTGSGATAHAENVTDQVWRVVIDSGGSGYGDVEITWAADPTVTDWGIVVKGRLSGSARRGSSSFSGSTPPTALIIGTTGGGAAITAYFMLFESLLPSLTATISGGQVTGVTIEDPGLSCIGLPQPTVTGGGGSGAEISVTTNLTANQTTDALGIPIALNGFAAWMNIFPLMHAVNLPPPTTPQTYSNAAPGVGGIGGTIWDGAAFVNVIAGGTGYTANFAVTITSATGHLYAGTAQVSGGTVQRVNTTSPGFLYKASDTIDWSAGSGSGAAGTITTRTGPYPSWEFGFTDGSITSIEVNNPGTGYTSPPAVTIESATGSGFVGSAVLTAGGVTSITISNHGHDYRSEDTVVFTGGGGFGASAQPITDGWIWWYLVYCEKPPHAAGYEHAPSGWFQVGYSTATEIVGDFGSNWLDAFGHLPPGGAHIPAKVVQIDNRYGTLSQPSTTDLFYAYGIGLALIDPANPGSGYSDDFLADLPATFANDLGEEGRVQVFVSGGVPFAADVVSTGRHYSFDPNTFYDLKGGTGTGCRMGFSYKQPGS